MEYTIIDYKSKLYPESLQKINNPPNKLYVMGNYNLLKENSLAVIGSRNCTNYGIEVTKKLVTELALRDICIISGMAKGIDSVAHKATLNVRGKTIAVLGSGFNNIYPKENLELFNDIIKNGGAVLTEYSPEIEPNSKNFPARNRIVSGLSLGVLVIEAAYRSGTSITANIAKSQGKKVMCIPSNIENKKGIGTNNLIKKGAILVRSAQDIINEFKEFKSTEERQLLINKKVDDKYKEIYDVINDKPITINELVKITSKNINEIEFILTMLELEDMILKIPNKGVIRKL